jgi:hypothetical protein
LAARRTATIALVPPNARLAVGAAGGLLLVVVLADIFVTIFAYDGFTFLAPRFHRVAWRGMRAASRLLPTAGRHAFLSLGSAALLPATLVLWLGLETAAFGMAFVPGLAGGGFHVSAHTGSGAGEAMYLSGGDLTSLTFGDLVPRAPLDRALVDLETVVGLATFTLGLTYVLSAFDALHTLNSLHARVRRNAVEPNKPSTIIQRRFRPGQGDALSGFLQSVVEDLEQYGEALRRYPVAFYFHTRRWQRSTPRIFEALGELVELLRWGLPSAEPVTSDPNLLALLDGYQTTMHRLMESFVGPADLDPPQPPDRPTFEQDLLNDVTPAGQFAVMEAEARDAAGLAGQVEDVPDRYRRFTEWLAFRERRRVFLRRVSDALGY